MTVVLRSSAAATVPSAVGFIGILPVPWIFPDLVRLVQHAPSCHRLQAAEPAPFTRGFGKPTKNSAGRYRLRGGCRPWALARQRAIRAGRPRDRTRAAISPTAAADAGRAP